MTPTPLESLVDLVASKVADKVLDALTHANHAGIVDQNSAEARAVGRRRFRAAVVSGELPGTLLGRRVLVKREDLAAWVARQRPRPRKTDPCAPPDEDDLAHELGLRVVRGGAP